MDPIEFSTPCDRPNYLVIQAPAYSVAERRVAGRPVADADVRGANQQLRKGSKVRHRRGNPRPKEKVIFAAVIDIGSVDIAGDPEKRDQLALKRSVPSIKVFGVV